MAKREGRGPRFVEIERSKKLGFFESVVGALHVAHAVGDFEVRQ